MLASAAVLVGAAAARHERAADAAASSSAASLVIPPLPSGAPVRETSPAPDDAEAGCSFPDRGSGDYAPARADGKAKLSLPASLPVDDDGSFPLLVHFHGGEAVRREIEPEGLGLALATVDAGVGSGAYAKAFADAHAFASIVEGAEEAVAEARKLPSARAWPILLSSWSAGYAAVGQVLAQKQRPINALVLLDSLYASYRPGSREVDPERLGGFVAFARAAASGDGPAMFLVHSGVPTPSYASTGEVASWLLGVLALDTTPATARPDAPFAPTRVVDAGRLHVRGYTAGDRDGHCAALRFLKSALRDDVLPVVGR
ncbi:MAG TPA: hypothetical protein VHB21_10060 [Minicystis sp.]|nr:hypothetical protein [Minicystis sp.]